MTPRKNPDGLQYPSNVFDRATYLVMRRIADQSSRRSFLGRLAIGAAAIAGVNFGLPFVVPTRTKAARADEPDCVHGDDCTSTGRYCGFHNYYDCDAFASGCPDGCNFNYHSGCPVGLSPGTKAWYSCCLCEGIRFGEIFYYWDCCGDEIPAACNDCLSNAVLGCSGDDDCEGGSWCGPGGGSPRCTSATTYNESCVSDNRGNVDW